MRLKLKTLSLLLCTFVLFSFAHGQTVKINQEAKRALLGHMVSFPFPGVDEAVGNPDLGLGYAA